MRLIKLKFYNHNSRIFNIKKKSVLTNIKKKCRRRLTTKTTGSFFLYYFFNDHKKNKYLIGLRVTDFPDTPKKLQKKHLFKVDKGVEVMIVRFDPG